QLDAAVKLSVKLMQKYHVPLQKIMPHRAVTEGTDCPGALFPWQEFMQRLSIESVSKYVK
ncbi:MAG: N-acetylmuramoyl-L-alanine amidase, partial [Candidatus Taylorbacteria bacterium]